MTVPPLPDAAKCLRVELIHQTSLGQPVVVRPYLQYSTTAPTSAQLDTFAGNVASAWGGNIAPVVHTDMTLENVIVTDLTSPTSARGESAPALAGTEAGTSLPADVAAVSKYAIARRYRGGQPKGFWPFGVVADLQDESNWSTTALGNFLSALESFYAGVVSSGWAGAGVIVQVAVSFYAGFTVVTSPTTGRARNLPTVRATPIQDPVTAIVFDPRIGSQRRRRGI